LEMGGERRRRGDGKPSPTLFQKENDSERSQGEDWGAAGAGAVKLPGKKGKRDTRFGKRRNTSPPRSEKGRTDKGKKLPQLKKEGPSLFAHVLREESGRKKSRMTGKKRGREELRSGL